MSAPHDPQPLSDGKVGTARVVRHGDLVQRATGPGAAAVHRLLPALAEAGFTVPRPVALTDGGETLTFVDGVTVRLPWQPWIADETLLVRATQLLRRLHDATVPLVEPLADERWWRWIDVDPAGPAEVIRHGDPWPPNLVVSHDDHAEPVGWIDWDFAQPGRRIDDVAAFAKHWAPLMSDERALGHGWPTVPDRPRRLRLIADAYGLDRAQRAELVDAAIRFGRVTEASHRRWAAQGHQTFAVMVARGVSAMIAADGAWLAEHRHGFDLALA